MGLIKAFAGAIGGTFADQWKDFVAPPASLKDHVLAAPGELQGQNAGRGSNTKGSSNIISNGSLIFVPEGTGVLLVSGGAVTGFITEAGGYEYKSDDVNSQSIFAGNGFFGPLIKQSWERFKFGGQPGATVQAIYINLKEIAGLNYGTQNPIRYKDANYNNIMLAVTSFGNYSIRIVDPIAFYKNFVPVDIAMGGRVFDINEAGVSDSLFSGFIGSLAAALSTFTKGGKSIDDIQNGTVEFAKAVDEAVEANYQWKTNYGIEVVAVQPRGLDWDDASIALIEKFNLGAIMQGNVGNAYAQATVAEGVKSAGENGGAGAVMGVGMVGNMMGGMMQQPTSPQNDITAGLTKLKKLLEDDLITQEEYDKKKAELLANM